MKDQITDHGEYESLRLQKPLGEGGRMHGGSGVPTMLQGGPGRTIVLSCKFGGYWTFRIKESGIEIPLANVASATPKGAKINGLRRRVDTVSLEKKRAERLARAEKRQAAKEAESEKLAKEKANARKAAAAARAARKQGYNDEPEDGGLDG